MISCYVRNQRDRVIDFTFVTKWSALGEWIEENGYNQSIYVLSISFS